VSRRQRQIALLPFILAALLLGPCFADAKSSHGGSGAGQSSHGKSHAGSSPRSDGSGGHAKATGVQRDSHGRIKRSASAKHDFEKSHPCPSTGKSSGACPGYVVDHVVPLKRGGADRPGNMQWQSREAAKQKDKTE
jgi:hypothetical protein